MATREANEWCCLFLYPIYHPNNWDVGSKVGLQSFHSVKHHIVTIKMDISIHIISVGEVSEGAKSMKRESHGEPIDRNHDVLSGVTLWQ
jgi:hypothetical protein